MPRIPQHKDIINMCISPGDAVVYSANNKLHIGFVKKINKMKITIAPLEKVPWPRLSPTAMVQAKPILRYPQDIVRLHAPSINSFLLTYQEPTL